MKTARRLALAAILAALVTPAAAAVAAAATSAAPAVPLTDRVGPEIDPTERARYGLFPDLREFETARFEPAGDGYRLVYAERVSGSPRERSRSVSRAGFEQTAWHLAFTDEYESLAGSDTLAAAVGAVPDLLRRLALRYASRRRYDLATAIAADLRAGFADAPAGAWATEALPRFEALSGPRRALFWPGSLLDQRGRTDLLVFSGTYGLWLGTAIPVALDADDAQAYAAGLLIAPAACVLIAANVTRDRPIPKGQATVIALGGQLGTWQGLGWSGLGEADGEEVVAAGVVTGLAGILLAVPLSNAVGFTEGHAEITSAGMYWGGWFGLVESILTGRDEDDEDSPLVDMLVGSDIGVVTAGIAARGARLSEGRMRLINLCGVLGAAFGGGLALLTEADDDQAVIGLLGAGSIA
ncbi:MAG TPA: hypothetical protein VFT32_11605, partial [Candidatus Eisenbacteria bacterium]|nr:hypothetical protein [Candidatus Eisenbacteria bacterium]